MGDTINYDYTELSADAQSCKIDSSRWNHQCSIEVRLTATGELHKPSAGTLTVSGIPPRGKVAVAISGTVDLTAGTTAIKSFTGHFEELRFSPASLDSDCSFSVRHAGSW